MSKDIARREPFPWDALVYVGLVLVALGTLVTLGMWALFAGFAIAVAFVPVGSAMSPIQMFIRRIVCWLVGHQMVTHRAFDAEYDVCARSFDVATPLRARRP